jgi:hypothetical protein
VSTKTLNEEIRKNFKIPKKMSIGSKTSFFEIAGFSSLFFVLFFVLFYCIFCVLP